MEVEFDCIDYIDSFEDESYKSDCHLSEDFISAEDFESFFEDSEDEELRLQEITPEIIDCLFLSDPENNEPLGPITEQIGFVYWPDSQRAKKYMKVENDED